MSDTNVSNGSLASLKLTQLKTLASQLGIKGTSSMRKSDLVQVILDHQRGQNATVDADATDSTGSTQSQKSAINDSQKSISNSVSQKRSKTSDQKQEHSDSALPPLSLEEALDDVQKRISSGGDTPPRNRRIRNRKKRSTQDLVQENTSNTNNSVSPADNVQAVEEALTKQQERRTEAESSSVRQRNRARKTERTSRNVSHSSTQNKSGNLSNTKQANASKHPEELMQVAGILDVLENYAFIRTSGYLPGTNDVYVSLNQVKKYGLRKGDAIVGDICIPQEKVANGKQKFNPLVQVKSINGKEPAEISKRVDFNSLVPEYPTERLRLETEKNKLGTRVIDLLSPVGKGQRGLIVSPPKAGKTVILQEIANAITKNNPEVHLMMVLVDERPEEVTDMERTVDGEIIASTFDRPAEDHTNVAELAIERAKRLVEQGEDVVVLLDSMTRLGRAYNLSAPPSGRVLSGGVDSAALYPPKKFFGAARNIENGGSLTILATALVETGSKMDEVIFEEFKGTGNMELSLSRQLADKRIFPAVDVNSSSTRREEVLLSPEEVNIMWKLRRVLAGLDPQQALETLTNKLKETDSNAEFLLQVQKGMPAGASSSLDENK